MDGVPADQRVQSAGYLPFGHAAAPRQLGQGCPSQARRFRVPEQDKVDADLGPRQTSEAVIDEVIQDLEPLKREASACHESGSPSMPYQCIIGAMHSS